MQFSKNYCFWSFALTMFDLCEVRRLAGTVAHKCTPNLNHSHYIQITRAEFKSPTPKIKSSHRIQKHSHQIQITHTKNQIFTPNSKTLAPNLNRSRRKSNLHTEFKNTRTKFKSLTPNSILHTEFKSLTPN